MKAHSLSLFSPALGMLLLSATSLADQHLAPNNQQEPVISQAIQAADDGETIWLAPGEYVERIEATDPGSCKRVHIIAQAKSPEDTVIRATRFRHLLGNHDLCPEGNMHVTFQNLTFASQHSREQYMDGLLAKDCTVEFINCRFVELQSIYLDHVDQAQRFETYGAVYLDQCTANFDRCEFNNNGVAFDRYTDETCKALGGAIRSFASDVTIEDSSFTGNYAVSRGHATDQATSTSMAKGGAVFAEMGTLSIRYSQFTENEATAYSSVLQPDEIQGGAIYALNLDSCRVDHCEFDANEAVQGGGAFSRDVGLGGAIYVAYWETYPFNGPGGVYLLDNQFSWNQSDIDGGAVYVEDDAKVKIRNSTFHCNSLEQAAGPWRDRGGNEFDLDCDPPCPADINGDGVVDDFDMFHLFEAWGKVKTDSQAKADLNSDNFVDNRDLIAWMRLSKECNDKDNGNELKPKK